MVDTTLWIAFSKDAKDTITTTPRLWKSLREVNTADGPVTPTGTAFQGDGQIARLQDGGYVIVWTDDSGTHNPAGGAIVGQRYDSFGNRVGGEVKISNFVAGFQFLPAITALPNGDVAVAYTDEIEGDQDIFVRIVGTGGASLSPGRIDNIDLGADLTLDPSITAFADGSYVISYRLQNSAADSDIVARIVSPTGTVGAQFDIDNQTDNRGLQELATLSNGNFVAVYRDEHNGDPLDTDIVFQILTPAGTSLTGPLVFPEGLLTPPQDHPDVAALRDGGFVMVWTDSLGPTATDIRAAILSNTAVLVAGASNIMVNTTTAGDQNEASVAALFPFPCRNARASVSTRPAKRSAPSSR